MMRAFFRAQFFIPRGGALIEWLPLGVPFESLSFYIFPYKQFFDLKFSNEIGRFFRAQFFVPRCGS